MESDIHKVIDWIGEKGKIRNISVFGHLWNYQRSDQAGGKRMRCIMNFAVTGYNECLIMYVLAAASPTHGVPAEVYHEGWARGGAIRNDPGLTPAQREALLAVLRSFSSD